MKFIASFLLGAAVLAAATPLPDIKREAEADAEASIFIKRAGYGPSSKREAKAEPASIFIKRAGYAPPHLPFTNLERGDRPPPGFRGVAKRGDRPPPGFRSVAEREAVRAAGEDLALKQ